VARTSTYRLRVKTDSADSNGILLLDDGELIAVLIELADESHGADCGKWVIETLFGLDLPTPPGLFDSAEDAAAWVVSECATAPH
jgi:hypothetical protein